MTPKMLARLQDRYRGKISLVDGEFRGWVRGPGDSTITMRVTDVDGKRTLWSGPCDELRPGRKRGNRNIGFRFRLRGADARETSRVRLFDSARGVELPFSPQALPPDTGAWIDMLNALSHWPLLHVGGLSRKDGRITAQVMAAGDHDPDALPALQVETAAGERPLTHAEIGAPVVTGDRRIAFWHAPSYPAHRYMVDLTEAFESPIKDRDGRDHVVLRIRDSAGHCRPIVDERAVGLIDVASVRLPPEENVRRVQARGNVATKFTTVAYMHFRTYEAVYETHADRPLGTDATVLDWGCGCARVTQQFMHSLGHERVHGADIDAGNIEWCLANLPGNNFAVCNLEPPLPYADDTFDLIVATSVFTHIREDLVLPWLHELNRVLKKGGIAALTIGGDTRVAFGSYVADRLAALAERGIEDHVRNAQLDGSIDDGDYYRNVRMTKQFVHEKWREAIDVLDIVDHGIGVQDIVVCRGR